MKYQVQENTFAHLGDRRFPLIIIDDEVDMFSAPYLVGMINKALEANTIRNHARAIVQLYRFCEQERINLPSQMQSLTHLTKAQVEALSGFLKASQDTGELVAPGTYAIRIYAVQKFIFYWWDTYQSRTSNSAEKLNHAKNKRAVMKAAFKDEEDQPWNNKGKSLKGLQPHLVEKLTDIINPLPSNKLNPFKSEHVRWRNYILILTMMLGGNRRSESVLLRIQDIQLNGKDKYFEVIKDPLAPSRKSPHKMSPSVKTLGRKIGISDDMAELFQHYILKQRVKFKGFLKLPDLFISTRRGHPLSVAGVNRVTETIIKAYPEFKGVLSPHRLRNTFHDLLSDAQDKLLDREIGNASPMMKQAQKSVIQEYAGGWTRGSKMTEKYPAGAIERRVMNITKTVQRNLIKKEKEAEDGK